MQQAVNDLVRMGVIIGAFGVKGWVKIKSSAPESLCHYKTVKLLNNNHTTEVTIEKYFIKDGIINAKLSGIDDRDAAFALRSIELAVSRAKFPEITASNEYYWVDLIGLDVYNHDNIKLGVVDSLIETGANDVLIVKSDDTERLIPFIAQYVTEVDLTNKKIIVDWGLDY